MVYFELQEIADLPLDLIPPTVASPITWLNSHKIQEGKVQKSVTLEEEQ